MRQRAGIIIKNTNTNKIVLIKRIKNNQLYWVIPGGGIEANETPLNTAIREAYEETGLTIDPTSLTLIIKEHEHTYYQYKCTKEYTLQLVGEELERVSPTNIIQPEWVDIHTLNTIDLLPSHIKEELIIILSQQ